MSIASAFRHPAARALAALALCAVPAGAPFACGGGDPAPTGTDRFFPLMYGDRPTIAQLADLGRALFGDPALSASGQLSCASCHDPRHAYGNPAATTAHKGGPKGDLLGFRNTPSLTYLHSPIPFTEHFLESEVTLGTDDQGPTGGRTWDGRVDGGAQQALMPLTDPNEMANADLPAIAARLQATTVAARFREVVSAPGENVFDDPEQTAEWVAVALATFEQTPSEFHPFTSKYDAWLRDQVELTAREQRGLDLFNDPKKGNCASCHPSSHKNAQARLPIFTDFGFIALGVPRNAALPANRDPAFHDLGLCGPLRKDLSAHKEYCGAFRTPTLRNVARRQAFFHNGAIHSLRDAVAFYATRDTDPARWYGRDAGGRPQRYDDLPAPYQANLERGVPFQPFADGRPRLDAAEIDDVVAFLKTLDDGYVVPKAGGAGAKAASARARR
jgi:cytochrome c peroxidase